MTGFGATARATRVDGSPTPRATKNFVEFPPPRPPSPPGPRPRRGPGRGAQGPFANQKKRWTSSFVLFFPARPHVGRAGPRAPRPSGSERPSSGPSCSSCTVYPHIVLLSRVSFLSPPALIRSSQSTAVSGVGHLGATGGSPGRHRARPRRRRLETLRRGLGRRAPPGFLRAGAAAIVGRRPRCGRATFHRGLGPGRRRRSLDPPPLGLAPRLAFLAVELAARQARDPNARKVEPVVAAAVAADHRAVVRTVANATAPVGPLVADRRAPFRQLLGGGRGRILDDRGRRRRGGAEPTRPWRRPRSRRGARARAASESCQA